MSKRESKELYFEKLKNYLDSYKTVFVVNVDNVGSNQMHQIRHSLRGEAVVLMGKNTMVRRAMKGFIQERPELEKLLVHVRGNVGFVFTNGDLKEIREKILENRVAAPARAGAYAPKDVFVPAGNTGMEPGKTSFFQALGIPTKISRGTIEIVSDVKVVTAGERVGASEASLLNMLNISPFTYGMSITQVFDDGTVFSPEVLDVEESTLVANLVAVLRDVASISLAVGYPTAAAVPHSIINGYKNLLAVSVASDYTFEGSEKIKEFLENPDAFVVAAAPAAAGEEKKEEAKEEEPEESDEDMGFGLFD
ncbi:60s acidic ribosomal protein p0 [Lichtheimia corymbifera JMRC:FSU:9682]|uniref:60S acidic ribosomal protein P0 n=1 Tax=Lichtheimia corymbifera JMRC:FSU:9682 TaxID=1263082 RepID=A0A068RSE0_9FUNG|nr:60s acidic ribosomal protein p0 [Lichtheimia corymbifera JMRC:FSU:9682]